MNKPVNFEIAKLLKEKGFNEITGKYWAKINQSNEQFVLNKDWSIHKWNSLDKPIWAAPSIAEVLMWLYDKHNVWIEILMWTKQPVEKEVWSNCFQPFVHGSIVNDSVFKTPTEAYEVALEYVLKNLIK